MGEGQSESSSTPSRRSVAILTSVHDPFDPRIFHKQARALAEAGYRVVVFAPSPETTVAHGVAVQGVAPPGARLGRPLVWLRLLGRALRLRADAYHCHDPELLPLGLLLQWLTGRPVIYDAHEYYRDEIALRPWLPRPLRRIAAETVHAIETFAVRHLAATVAVNEHMAAGFRRRGARRVITVHNYPRLADFERGAGQRAAGSEAVDPLVSPLPRREEPSGADLAVKQGRCGPSKSESESVPPVEQGGSERSEPGGLAPQLASEPHRSADTDAAEWQEFPTPTPHSPPRLSILYLGLLNQERGLSVVWQAARLLHARLPRVSIDIVGRIDWGSVPAAVPRDADRWRREAGVALRGVIPAAETPAALAGAAIGWIPFQPTPNNARAVPLKLLEYMATGLPVVASDLGVLAAIVRESGCGLLAPPADAAAHAEALATLLHQPETAAAMGARGRRAVRDRYTWEAEQGYLLALYAGLLGRRRPAPAARDER